MKGSPVQVRASAYFFLRRSKTSPKDFSISALRVMRKVTLRLEGEEAEAFDRLDDPAPPAARLPGRGRWMTLPLAHHNTIVALPVFAPAIVLVIHHLRERRRWEDEEDGA